MRRLGIKTTERKITLTEDRIYKDSQFTQFLWKERWAATERKFLAGKLLDGSPHDKAVWDRVCKVAVNNTFSLQYVPLSVMFPSNAFDNWSTLRFFSQNRSVTLQRESLSSWHVFRSSYATRMCCDFLRNVHIHTNTLNQHLGCTFNAKQTHGQMYIMQPRSLIEQANWSWLCALLISVIKMRLAFPRHTSQCGIAQRNSGQS